MTKPCRLPPSSGVRPHAVPALTNHAAGRRGCHAIDGAERELRGSSEATIYRAAVADHDKLRGAPAASRRAPAVRLWCG